MPSLRFSQRLALLIGLLGIFLILFVRFFINANGMWPVPLAIGRDMLILALVTALVYGLAERELRLRAHQVESELETLRHEAKKLQAEAEQARTAQANQAMQLEAALTQLKNFHNQHEQAMQAQRLSDAAQADQQSLVDALLQIPTMTSRAHHLIDFNADLLTIMHNIAPHQELKLLTYDHSDQLMGLRRTQGAMTATPSYVDHDPQRPLLARLLAQQHPLTHEDCTDLDWANEFQPEHPRSFLASAISFGGKPLGFILLASQEDSLYNDAHKRHLWWLCQAISPSIQLIRTIHKNRESGFFHERTRIARHLHDNLAQQLFHLSMTSDYLAESAQGADAKLMEGLRQLAEAARQTNQEVRNLIEDIRPDYIHKYTLATLIEQSAERFRKRSGISVNLDLEGDTQGIPYHVKESIGHIVEEGLHNIYKHAKAKQVSIRLHERESEQAWVLSIEDDGRGFQVDLPLADKHLGVKIMRDRAKDIQAEFHISSTPNQGTTLELKWSK